MLFFDENDAQNKIFTATLPYEIKTGQVAIDIRESFYEFLETWAVISQKQSLTKYFKRLFRKPYYPMLVLPDGTTDRQYVYVMQEDEYHHKGFLKWMGFCVCISKSKGLQIYDCNESTGETASKYPVFHCTEQDNNHPRYSNYKLQNYLSTLFIDASNKGRYFDHKVGDPTPLLIPNDDIIFLDANKIIPENMEVYRFIDTSIPFYHKLGYTAIDRNDYSKYRREPLWTY